jgi:hypothetical protein
MVRLVEMPGSIKAYTVRKDGYHTILINSILTREQQLKEYDHEYKHIINGDFDKTCSVDMIEIYAHK